MGTSDALERGREAFAADAWREAYEHLTAADRAAPLGGADLERLAVAAYLTGNDDERFAVMERAHLVHRDAGSTADAARSAFWLGMGYLDRGETSQGSGWLARASRLLADAPDGPEQAYVQIPTALQALGTGRTHEALATARDIVAAADRFDDADLAALGGLLLGQARVAGGDVVEGMRQLDEVMVAVRAGEVSPVPAGIIYCSVISVCQQMFDLERAGEWTAALTAWCEAHPDLVPYRGQCLVHRAEILQLHGEWAGALAEARRASERLSDPPGQPAVGAAYYRQAELHRLRGELAEAEEAYRHASRHGHSPQPGLAQLRVAQGQIDAATAGIRRALDEEIDPGRRAGILAVGVEVALAADDLSAARAAATELAELTDRIDAPVLRAVSAHVHGALRLVEGEASEALALLRDAWRVWHELDAPFEAARVRVLVGLACRQLGDDDGATLEFEAARATLNELGADPELARLEALVRDRQSAPPGGLTDREVEVIRLVARGLSNRAIAHELVISEHTVARHVQNIFAKLAVDSRTAAAAFAYEHDLV